MDGVITRYGWVCPKCGNVYAPFVVQCTTCGVGKEPKRTVEKKSTAEGKQLLTEVTP